MMRSISNELSVRARALLKRDGHISLIHFRESELRLSTLTLWVDVDGVLVVEQNYTHGTLYTESPTGVILTTSPDNILERAIDELRQRMVLEDLSDV